MKFTISIIVWMMLLSLFGINASAKHYHLQGLPAEKVFNSFLKEYAISNSRSISKNIPILGGMYQIMKSMIYIKAVQQIDPNGIDKLLKKYELSHHSFRFKQLFLIILSEMQAIDRLTPISVSISTNDKGYIQWLEAITFNKRNGVMRLGKHFFKQHPLHITSLGARDLEGK